MTTRTSMTPATPARSLVLDRIPALARRMMRLENDSIQEVCPIGIIDFEKWEWPQGVGLYALWKIATTLGDDALLRDIDAWFTRRLAEPLPPRNVNTTTPSDNGPTPPASPSAPTGPSGS